MKKLLIVMMAIIFVTTGLAIYAGGGKKEEKPAEKPVEEKPVEKPAEPGVKLMYGFPAATEQEANLTLPGRGKSSPLEFILQVSAVLYPVPSTSGVTNLRS